MNHQEAVMIVDQTTQTCAHEGCTCEVPAGQTYCGPHCANAATANPPESQSHCGCGHPQCNGSKPDALRP